MSINYTPRTWVAGEVVSAAEMNTEVRDALTGVQAAWTAYTPTWTATTTNPTLNNGTLVGKWQRLGKTYLYRINLTMGSTTAFGTGSYLFALPAAVHADYTAGNHMGNGVLLDVGVNWNQAAAAWNSSTQIFVLATSNLQVSNTVPFTWGSGDKLSLAGEPEAA